MKKCAFLTYLLLMVIVLTSSTQSDPFKAIVLINGEAYLVDITEKGTITATYQKITNYFQTSESHSSILSRLTEAPRAEGGGRIVFYEKEVEPPIPFEIENELPIINGNAQYIGFSPLRALLKKEAVDQIRNIARQYQSGVIQTIRITSQHRDSYQSRALARNRAQAIHDLLEAFGVTTSIIVQDIPYAFPGEKTDFVKISF